MEETILVGDDLMLGPPSPLIPQEIASHVLEGVDLCDGILRNLFLCKWYELARLLDGIMGRAIIYDNFYPRIVLFEVPFWAEEEIYLIFLQACKLMISSHFAKMRLFCTGSVLRRGSDTCWLICFVFVLVVLIVQWAIWFLLLAGSSVVWLKISLEG